MRKQIQANSSQLLDFLKVGRKDHLSRYFRNDRYIGVIHEHDVELGDCERNWLLVFNRLVSFLLHVLDLLEWVVFEDQTEVTLRVVRVNLVQVVLPVNELGLVPPAKTRHLFLVI